MGYTSEVVLAVMVRTEAQAEELMAIYAMDPRVQKHALLSEWVKHVYPDLGTCFVYHNSAMKWYPEFESVRGMERLLELAKTFGDERGTDLGPLDDYGHHEINIMWPYAVIKIEIGEDLHDIHYDLSGNNSLLEDALSERASVQRQTALDF